jgi:adenosylcobinamide-GDP ribazoletransferase
VFAGLRLAVGTLTIIPVGALGTVDRGVAGRAMALAPIAVVPLAVAAAAVGWLAALLGLPTLGVGLLVLGMLAVGTRGLHLDGLADTVDGLGAGWDRERSLQVMRRGDVGPMGVVALVLVLGLQAIAAGQLLHGWRGALLVAILICVSRGALVGVCARGVPAARPDGLGVVMAGSVPRATAVVSALLLTLLVGLMLAVLQRSGGTGLLVGVLVGLAAGAGVALLVRRAVRRFGGVTGDVMGAAIETALTVLLVGAVLGTPR